jgi:hypothetical protein
VSQRPPLPPPTTTPISYPSKVSVGQTTFKNLNVQTYRANLQKQIQEQYTQNQYQQKFDQLKHHVLRNIQSVYSECLFYLGRILDPSKDYDQLKYSYWTQLRGFATSSTESPPHVDDKDALQPLHVAHVFDKTLDWIYQLPDDRLQVLKRQLSRAKVFHDYVRSTQDKPNIRSILMRSPLTQKDILVLRKMVPPEHVFYKEWLTQKSALAAPALAVPAVPVLDVTRSIRAMFRRFQLHVQSLPVLEYVVWSLMKQLDLLVIECQRILFSFTTTPDQGQQHNESHNGEEKKHVQ